MSTTDDRAELLALDAFDEGGSWDAPSHVRFLRAQGDGSSGFTADLIEKLYQALRTRAATALTGARAEIERLTADRNQMMKQVAELGRQLAAETERCACIAQDNRQHSNQIVMRTLEAESAYEEACDDIAAAIRVGAK